MSRSNEIFDPQLSAAYRLAAEIQAMLGPAPPGLAGVRAQAEQARQWWNEGGPAMAIEREVELPMERRALRAVLYQPRACDEPLPAYVYLHGGGFRLGGPRSSDRMLRDLASAWGGIVLSLDYVHVPEHVFPTAVEDTAAALRWLRTNGPSLGIDGNRLAFGGSSAGANIALGAAIELCRTDASNLRAGVLFVGTYDQDFDTESMHLFGGDGFFPTRLGARQTIEAYVPDAGLRRDPRVNCVLAVPPKLPPLFLAAAGMDVFRDSSRRLSIAARAAGVSCELVEYPGMGHLFTGYSRIVEGAQRCIGDAVAHLRNCLPVALP